MTSRNFNDLEGSIDNSVLGLKDEGIFRKTRLKVWTLIRKTLGQVICFPRKLISKIAPKVH